MVQKETMSIKYRLQKFIGRILDSPTIPKGKTIGYSLVKSEKSNCTLGENTKLHAPYFLHNVIVGDYSYIAKNSSICNCDIGKFCSIGPNFCCGLGIHPINGISTSPFFYSTAKQNGSTLCKENKIEESLHTTIGNDVFIGANVTVLDGVRIGDGAVVGAGAVVTKDIPPYAVVVGVPAEIKKFRFEAKTIEALLASKWWDKGIDGLKVVEESFFSPEQYAKMIEK